MRVAWSMTREIRQTDKGLEGRTKAPHSYGLGDSTQHEHPRLRLIEEALGGVLALPVVIYYFVGPSFFATWGWTFLGVAAAGLLGDILLSSHEEWSTRRTWGTVVYVFVLLLELWLWLVVRAAA